MIEKKGLDEIIKALPLFEGLDDRYVKLVAGCASNVRFEAGEMMFREGETSETFYAIRHGKVGIEIFVPQRGAMTIQTLGQGDLIGLSWLFPPYRWSWRARALDDTDVVAFDAARVRAECESDPHLELEVLRIVSAQAVARLHSSRTQLLDLYEFPR